MLSIETTQILHIEIDRIERSPVNSIEQAILTLLFLRADTFLEENATISSDALQRDQIFNFGVFYQILEPSRKQQQI